MQDGTGMAGSPGDPGSVVDAGPPSSGRQGALRGRRALGLHHQTLGPGTEINQFFLHSFLFNLFTRIFFYGVIYMRIISLTDFFLHSSPLWSVTPVLGLD